MEQYKKDNIKDIVNDKILNKLKIPENLSGKEITEFIISSTCDLTIRLMERS